MSDYLIQSETLTDIADAIRAKTGGNALINPEDMASEIGNIPTGDILESLWEDSGIVMQDNIVYRTTYQSTTGKYYIDGQPLRRATDELITPDNKKMYRGVSRLENCQFYLVGYTQKGLDQMEEQETITGGTSGNPTTQGAVETGWIPNKSVMAPMYGVKKFIIQQNVFDDCSRVDGIIQSVDIDVYAEAMKPTGYEVDRIIYPNEIFRGSGGVTTYPYYNPNNVSRDCHVGIECSKDYDYIIENPRHYTYAIWQCKESYVTAFNNHGSVQFNDLGWQNPMNVFSPTYDCPIVIFTRESPENTVGFFVVYKKLREVN